MTPACVVALAVPTVINRGVEGRGKHRERGDGGDAGCSVAGGYGFDLGPQPGIKLATILRPSMSEADRSPVYLERMEESSDQHPTLLSPPIHSARRRLKKRLRKSSKAWGKRSRGLVSSEDKRLCCDQDLSSHAFIFNSPIRLCHSRY
ncbi:hypothetical protein BKA70DRAFT_1438293 [Coprinopsis sp. MPI-PUGE-AT-0042]|nr:hypothetical protein BKA70DRAFT_1438293 [Coprinopsis sp. MPI-PUGE-AT-0042]